MAILKLTKDQVMKKSENNNRLAVLNARREKLIELNQKYHYTSMVLTKDGLKPNPKEKQYTNLLLRIHEEKVGLWIFNRENNKVYSSHLNNAKNAVASLSRNHLFNLTYPLV